MMRLFCVPRAQNKKDQAPHQEDKEHEFGSASRRDREASKSNQCDY
jgi:hypothetical protein